MTIDINYRYFVTDLVSNEILGEIPFKGVSFERANRRAGSFTGRVPFLEATKGLDLYEITMPGRTGLYVMRNGVCVWGGMIWSRQYDVNNREMRVEGAEFTSYFYHRNIWQTIQYGSDFIGVFAFQTLNGIATITTEIAHGFQVGDQVRITFTNPVVDGVHTVSAVPAANTFQFETTSANENGLSTSGAVRSLVDTYDFARDLIFRMATDLGGIYFANEVIKPAKEFQAPIISKRRSAGKVTLRTGEDHSIIPGHEVEILEIGSDMDGFRIVTDTPDSRTIVFDQLGPDVPETSVPGIRFLNVLSKQSVDGVATLTLSGPHGVAPGQEVLVLGVDLFFSGSSFLDTEFNGRFVVVATPSANSIQYITGAILNSPPQTVAGGIAAFGSRVLYGDFGSFTANGDIDLSFDGFEKSGFFRDTQVIRGFEQKTVGEILEEYSNTVEGGFEYRIDCDYDYDTSSFIRTFRLLPVDLAVAPPPGEVYPVTAFGAEKLVFEYPGNIRTFTVSETAEPSATRFFVVGSIEDLSDEASQPYAGASAKDLLNNPFGKSWPLLDQVEQLDSVESEEELYGYAQDYLFESRPPVGDYNLRVNGSLSPQVGTYFPGQWCSIIIDDEFIRQRLASDQEPRSDILIRKIESFKVTVPDSANVPEDVDLTLVTDWKTDRRGN
jgi:hypothetical protein